MALAMARPYRHPKTGVFWLRKRVPDALRPVVGKREELRSLGTKDVAEAKLRFAQALAELEEKWSNLRRGLSSLSEREAHQLACVVHDRIVETYRENPSEFVEWRIERYDRLWPSSRYGEISHIGSASRIDLASEPAPAFETADPPALDMLATRITWACAQEAQQLLADRGMAVDDLGRVRLTKAIAAAKQRAALLLREQAQGNFHEPRAASAVHPAPITERPPPLPLDELVDGWAAEKRPVAKTVYEWRRTIQQFAIFLGHDDARKITADNIFEWKNALVTAGRRPKTIRDAMLAPLRAVLRWAVDNRKLNSNPAERVTLGVKVKPGEGRRSFDDAEAKAILTAAMKAKNPVLRWVPQLCAYSGARVSEVCQLRREDVVRIDGLWCMRFDAEAGSLKNAGSERTVPLHDVLIANGFLDFVATIASGPLFKHLPPDKFGKRGGNGTKVLGRWVRSLGIDDPRLAPNHSWRHRFKTSARRFGLAPDLVDAMTGHAKRSVGDRYGEYPVAALHRELAKLPDILAPYEEG